MKVNFLDSKKTIPNGTLFISKRDELRPIIVNLKQVHVFGISDEHMKLARISDIVFILQNEGHDLPDEIIAGIFELVHMQKETPEVAS